MKWHNYYKFDVLARWFDRWQNKYQPISGNEDFTKILNSITDYIWSADVISGDVVYRNYSTVVQNITGFPPGFFMSGVGAWLSIVNHEDRPRVKQDLKRALSGEPVKHEYRIINKNGETRWLLGTTSPTLGKEGEVIRLDGVVSDITKQKEAEKELNLYINRIEGLLEINQAISSTRDLNEILTIIMDELKRYIPYDSVSVQLMHEDQLVIVSSYGFQKPEEVLGIKFPLESRFPNYEVITKKEVLAIEDITKAYPHFKNRSDEYRSSGIRSWMGVPLISKDEVLGMFTLDRYVVNPFFKGEVEMATAFANQAALAIENANLFDEANQRLERLSVLRQIDKVISGSLDLHVTMDVLLEHVIQQLDLDATALFLLDEDFHTLAFASGKGFQKMIEVQYASINLGDSLAGNVALSRNPMYIKLEGSEFSPGLAKLISDEQFEFYAGVPLIAKGRVFGVIEGYMRCPFDPNRDWIEYFETIAGQAAIAVDNITLYENLQRSNLELSLGYAQTIEGWARTLEMRDDETEGHSKRVTDLTVALAKKMGMSSDEIVNVRRGALLHDIGKMNIPDKILHKPGPLDDDEWEIMRKHTEYAYEFLSPITFLKTALDIPRYHHEKWNGSGYPFGLKGDQIPLAARIFAIVDVWDALLSDRPYRKAWPQDKVIAHIKEQAGAHFDPQVVEAFLGLIR